jgi:multicomponent Na+:H+ antiporter subunit E
MKAFVYNVVLTVFWMLVTESFTLSNFLVGFAISFLILLLARPLFDAPSRRYFTLAWKLPRFVALMLWEIVLLSLDVSSDRKVLYVHGMFVDNPQAVIQSTHDSLEKAVLEVTR